MGFFKNILAVVVAILGIKKEVCYHDYGIGCFNNRSPFDNAKNYVPQSPAKIGVKLLLFSRQTIGGTELSESNLANFHGKKPTKLIIHGFKDDGGETWIQGMRKAILKREDVNVIVVDWDKGANNVLYEQASANTRVVGALLAKLLTSLHNTGGATYEAMHLIGHSLGAHVAGYAGERVKGLGRITGLDPAGPLFENKDPRVRLDSGDASFVDVIHTDVRDLLELGFGIRQAVGHADFYPNDGERQPGCKKAGRLFLELLKFTKNSMKTFVDGAACSHLRAYAYFMESINSSCRFRAYPCKTCSSCGLGCADMGYDANTGNPRGKFYLTTQSSSPFCIP